MRNKLKYSSDFDNLTAKEVSLLDQACTSIKEYVIRSGKINNKKIRTRDAHATSYGALKGTFTHYRTKQVKPIFFSKQLDCTIRISNAHMKIVPQKRTIPAYGFSLALTDNEGVITNIPMVNFPLFPITDISRFLKIFTSINYFFSGNLFRKFWNALTIIKNMMFVIPDFFQLSFIREVFNFIQKKNHFILSFDYHSIGVYRFGDDMIKYKLVPLDTPKKSEEQRIDLSIKNYFQKNDYELELMVQYCYNQKEQPINQLNKLWKNSEFIPIGKIKLSELIDRDDALIEKMSFNPFENIPELQPVGRLQKLRNKAYQTSLEARRENISN
ncbi:catalase family protein [Epilithonimonas hominis]|uniref:Catalase n=1 Tax=Epilithonimonas hominis TaxID=420404 RepID=A0A1H6LH34_9FLAO|nr:hypothetical protein [Epilithonimonas hominis]SEH87750.1 hypothetical protein SAMN05421793_1446 [Epilithonimonas hominis]